MRSAPTLWEISKAYLADSTLHKFSEVKYKIKDHTLILFHITMFDCQPSAF